MKILGRAARWAVIPFLACAVMLAAYGPPARAELYDDVVKPKFTIKFRKGTFTPLNTEDIHEAALIAKSERRMVQVEGFSCVEDGDGGGKPAHRVDMADKRAGVVMSLLIQYGVAEKDVFTMAYEYGNCVAEITIL